MHVTKDVMMVPQRAVYLVVLKVEKRADQKVCCMDGHWVILMATKRVNMMIFNMIDLRAGQKVFHMA